MNKIYYVVIKGRTLESRNLKELLSRAVTEKRNLDRKSAFHTTSHGNPLAGNAPNLYDSARKAAAL